MITQRAALLGFVAFCFYLIAVVNVLESYFYALTWAAIGIFGASLGLALLSLIGLECKIEMKRGRANASLGNEFGVGPLIAVSFSNNGTLNKTGTLLELRLRDPHDLITTHRFVVEAVPSGATIESELPLHNLKRGIYVLQEAKIVGSDVLGLFRVQRRLQLDATKKWDIVVGPAILRGDKSATGGDGAIPAQSQRALQAGRGDELRGTRPYSPGDDLRHVHWKSSARVGELVVKEFELTGRQAALVVWDGAQNTTWGKGDFDSTEWSLILCASLCRSLLSGGTSCDFARLDGAPKFIESRSLIGSDLPGPLSDALAEASPRRQTTLDSAIFNLPTMARRHYSTIYLVTASLSPDVTRAATFWGSRGAPIQILLVNGASLMAQGVERRKKTRGRIKTQISGQPETAITEANYEAQTTLLRESAGYVVQVRTNGGSPSVELRTSLHNIFDPYAAGMKNSDRSTV